MESSETGMSRHQFARGFLFIAIVSVFLYAFQAHMGTYDNAASRLDLAYSLAIKKTVSIDAVHGNTIDKAFYEGHYYSDKAPGLSLAAWPVIKVLSVLAPGVAWHPDNQSANWIIVFIVVGIPSIIALYFLYALCSKITGKPAVIPVLIYAAGSMALPYSTLFYSHQFCASLLIFMLYLYLTQLEGSKTPSLASGVIYGFLAGWGAISEYTIVIPAAIILVAAILNSKKPAQAVGMLAGVILPGALLLWYNNACFGNPLHIGYMYEVNDWFREEMSKGAGGVTAPNPIVLLNLIFQPQRGLLWEHPFLLLAVPGFLYMMKAGKTARSISFVSIFAGAAIIIINASYYEPYGGFSPGPRFLVPALPFLFISAAFAWTRLGDVLKGLFAGAGLFSIALFTLLNAVEPHVPHIYLSPLMDFTVPLLGSGYIPQSIPFLPQLSSIAYFIILGAISLSIYLFAFSVFSDADEADEGISGLIVGFLIFAVAILASALPIKPEKGLNPYYLGAAMNVNRQYDQAETFFLNAVGEKPDFYQAWYSLGISQTKIAQYNINKYNDSIASFEETIKLNPEYLQGYISLVAVNLTISRFEEAEYRVEQGLEKFPGNPVLMELKRKTGELSEKARR